MQHNYIKSKKSTSEKVKKWFINHIHPKKRLPVLSWLPKYKLEYLKGDIISGVSIGLLLVPQSLAIAGIFGCPPIVGLYSSMAGPFSSFFLSTSPDNSVGPTVLVAIVGSRFNEYGSTLYLSMISFFSGLVMILMSFFNAGVLMNFVSFTVLSAFISCGSLSIAISQLPGLFGIKIPNSSHLNSYQLLYKFFTLINNTIYQDLIIGSTVVFLCLFCHYTMNFVIKNIKKSNSDCKTFFWKTIWLIYVSKNALITIIITLVIYFFYNNTSTITLTGKLQKGFPKPWFPIQSLHISVNNTKITLSPLDIISEIYPSFFLAPIMMFVETLALVKNYSKQKDYKADSTQELLNVGVANIINSFFRGYPIGGALSRSALNSISGVQTCFSGIITIVIVVLALMVLTSFFSYTPKAALAAMLFSAVIPSIAFGQLKLFWRVQKWELFPWIATFVVGLHRLELGMLVGLAISSGFILFREMRPKLHRIHHQDRGQGAFSVRLRSALHYPCAVFITDRIKSFIKRFPELKELEIDCHAMNEIDMTVAKELFEVVDKLKKEKNIQVRFSYVKQTTVRKIMIKMGLGPYICDETKIPAENCRHCHSYHNHAFQSNNGQIRRSFETMQSAPARTTLLAMIKEDDEISNQNEIISENKISSNITNESENKIIDIKKKDYIHTSETDSESSTSATEVSYNESEFDEKFDRNKT